MVSLLSDNFDAENDGLGTTNYTRLVRWDIKDGSVDLIGRGYFDFLPGNSFYLDLDGTTSNAGRLESKQTFTFKAGDVVTLQFSLAGSQRGDTNAVTVFLGNLFSETFSLLTNQPFTTITRTLNIGSAGSGKLIFDHSGGDNVGILLDNVQLSVSDLPGSFDTVPDYVANTIANAQDLGVLVGSRSINEFIGGSDANDYFRFELTKNSQFKLAIANLKETADVMLLDHRGVEIKLLSANGNGAISLERLPQGAYYIRVSRFSAKSTPYSLDVNATPIVEPLQISRVTPNQGGNIGQTTITVVGTEFTSKASVTLVDDKGAEKRATKVVRLSQDTLSATFDLQGAALNTYDVRVRDGSQTATATGAFGVKIGAIGQVEVYLSAPSRVRATGNDVVTITYRNTGNNDVTAPLLSLEAVGGLLQSAGSSTFTESQLQFLGISRSGAAGVLAAGESSSFTVRFKPTVAVGGKVDFSVKGVAANETVNWDAIKTSAKPANLTDAAWDAVWNNFKAGIGNKAGDYQTVLAENATYLSQLGEYSGDVKQLLGFELQQASNYQTLNQQYSQGSLGQGRAFPGDIRAIADSAGNVTIQNAGVQRAFTRQADGSYRGASGDFAILTQDGSGYQLREQDGTVTQFQTSGQFTTITDPNGNQIAAVYSGTQLSRLDYSNGDRLNFTYNGQGRVASVSDQAGRTTTYSYDATGNQLLSVTTPQGTTRYTYTTSGAIATITDANGVQARFDYDARGRLIRQSSSAETLTYSYDSTGGVTVTNAAGQSTQYLLNDQGQVSQIQDALGRQVQLRHNSNGDLTRLTAADDPSSGYTYDDRGNLISQVDASGYQTRFLL